MEEVVKKAMAIIKRVAKTVIRTIILVCLPVILIFMLLAAALYHLTIDDGTWDEDSANVPYNMAMYTSATVLNEDGTFGNSMNIAEVWDNLVRNHSRITQYLDSPEELATLVNAQIVTQMPDTRENPDEEINWDNVDLVNGPIQGIVKFKRANQEGDKKTLTYVPREQFYTWLEDYNENGSTEARNNILNHFTVKQTTNYQINGFGTDVTADISERIVQAAQSTPSPGAGYCQKWVRQVYVNAGLENVQYGSAYEAYQHCCVSQDMNNIPVGAAVYGTGVRWAGHVGIYIGNGMVMDNVGQIKTQTLEEWLSWQHNTLDGRTGWLGWGWQSGQPVITSTGSNENTDNHQEDDDNNTQNNNESEVVQQVTSSTTFAVEVATWNQTETKLESNDPNVETYSNTDYHIQVTAINYQQLVEKYSMPFDLLWGFIVTGRSKDFALAMSDLAYNSKLEITVYDNYNKNTQVDTWTYKKQTKNDVRVNATGTGDDEGGGTHTVNGSTQFTDVQPHDYTTTKTVVTQTNTLSYALTLADSWCMKTEGDYTFDGASSNTSDSQATRNNTSYPAAAEAVTHEEYPNSAVNELEGSLKNQLMEIEGMDESSIVIAKSFQVEKRSRYINIVDNITNTTETSIYTYTPPVVTEKVNETTEPNFVTVFNNGSYNRNRTNIISGCHWLFTILKTNESTNDMVDLVKYLLYKATGNGYGITEFDFNAFNPNGFSSVSDIRGGNVEEQVWYALRSAGFSEYATAGAMGNIYGESGFRPQAVEGGYNENNGGIGLCQWTNNSRGSRGRNANLKNYANSRGANWQDVNIQIQFLLTELTGEGDASGYASKAFISNRMYDRYYSDDVWKNATSVEEATRAFCATFERPGKTYFYSSMNKRVEAAQGYYNQYAGKDLSSFADASDTSGDASEASGKAREILRIADSKKGCRYVEKASGPNTFDCSGFTSWCYAQAGITIPRSSGNQKAGAKQVVDVKQARPGDILWKSGHVGLCVSNDNGKIRYIHSPHSGDVVRYANGGETYFTHALRYID